MQFAVASGSSSGADKVWTVRYQCRQCKRFCFSSAGFINASFVFPGSYRFKKQVVIEVLLARKRGYAAVFVESF